MVTSRVSSLTTRTSTEAGCPGRLVPSVVVSVLQERRGEASEWQDVSAASNAEGRMVANVRTTSRVGEDEEIHLRVLVLTHQQHTTGEFAFDVLRSSSTCTKHNATTDLHPKLELQTGSSIVLKWSNGGVTLADDGLQRLHGQPLSIYVRCVTSPNANPNDLNCQRYASNDSQGSVDDAEPSEGSKLFNPVDLTTLDGQSMPHLIELTSLGQGIIYETCCRIQLLGLDIQTFVITPTLRGKTWFGDADDFYDRSEESELGSGGYGTVYKGWHLRRPLVSDANTKEDRAVKVFGLDSRNTDQEAYTAWQHEKKELKHVRSLLEPSSDALRCMIKSYSKVCAASLACARSCLD